MDRSTVTACAKAMGGKVLDSRTDLTCYQFESESATLQFRKKIPFQSLWGGQGTNPNIPPLNVYFDMPKANL